MRQGFVDRGLVTASRSKMSGVAFQYVACRTDTTQFNYLGPLAFLIVRIHLMHLIVTMKSRDQRITETVA
jgi:hypothetical protein